MFSLYYKRSSELNELHSWDKIEWTDVWKVGYGTSILLVVLFFVILLVS